MATKKVPLVFTEEEKELAKKLKEYANQCSNSRYIENLWEAAKYYGYDNYGEVPLRIKQCISSVAGIRSGVAKRCSAKIKVVPKTSTPQKLSAKEEWYKEVSHSKTMQHALHPQDEEDLVEFFRKQ